MCESVTELRAKLDRAIANLQLAFERGQALSGLDTDVYARAMAMDDKAFDEFVENHARRRAAAERVKQRINANGWNYNALAAPPLGEAERVNIGGLGPPRMAIMHRARTTDGR